DFQTALEPALALLNDSTAAQADIDQQTDQLHQAYLDFLDKRLGITDPWQADNYMHLAASTAQWAHYNVHDPTVVRSRGYFYEYGTDAAWGYSVKGIPYRRSRDLVNWEYRGTVFDAYPQEVLNWKHSVDPNNSRTMTGIWAPYILKVGSEFRLYYSAIFSDAARAMIVLATSNSPEGPWTNRGWIVHSTNTTVFNAIDPTVTIGKDNSHWMLWGSWTQGIYAIELDPATGLRKGDLNSYKRITRNGPQNTWGWTSSYEGPEVIYHPELDYYYLFIAHGALGNVYHTRVARSKNPDGPYYDYYGNNVNYTVNRDIYPLICYPYQFQNHSGWQGISHVSAFASGGDYFLMNQGRPSFLPTMMIMHTRKIFWTSDGWPTLSPQRYTRPGIMPAITRDSIPGKWEEIRLYELMMSNGLAEPLGDDDAPDKFLCKSNTMTFNADGRFSSNFGSGSWNFENDTLYIKRDKESKRIPLIPFYELDWENHRPSLLFTGINPNNGRSLWAKKVPENVVSYNWVTNGSFDEGLKDWALNTYGGSFSESVVSTTYGSGNSFYVKVNSPSANYWDRELKWRVPVRRGMRYKISFLAKSNSQEPFHIEMQRLNGSAYNLRTTFVCNTAMRTSTFITGDAGESSGIYVLNFQYGTHPAGTELWIDEVKLEELSGKDYGNYVTNGDFETGTEGWNMNYSGNVAVGLDRHNPLSGQASLYGKVGNASSLIRSMAGWKVYLFKGRQYRLEFDARGSEGSVLSVFFDTQTAKRIENTLHPETRHYSLLLDSLSESKEYTLNFSFSKNQQGSECWIDNIELCDYKEPAAIVNPGGQSENHALLYPNPGKGLFYLDEAAAPAGSRFYIYNSAGILIKELGLRGRELDLTELQAGLYYVKWQGRQQLQKIIIQ
ncbi:MAG TPA: family 43 glycosylhydrolase, partial [Bacteroidales bacterium]|nr:family 43 glycosylhydrolase [Bacteroidales bacterium]